MYNISLIKYLFQAGYRQKLICIITGYPQSYVSRNKTNPKPYIPTMDTANEEQLRRKYVVDRILECRKLRKFDSIYFSQQDKIYCRLLVYCLVEKDKVRSLYPTTAAYRVGMALQLDKDVIKDFDPLGLDIDEDDYKLFLESALAYDEKK